MPTQNRVEDRWLSGFLRPQAYTKPTQSLHDAYISLHGFGALQRVNKNHLTHLQVLCFLHKGKFSREFCGIQVD